MHRMIGSGSRWVSQRWVLGLNETQDKMSDLYFLRIIIIIDNKDFDLRYV